jgi:transcriptional regulator with XRE-family HTH domain
MAMSVSDRFGENVLRIRQARKLTQESLAERAQIHRTQITLVETGRRQPGIETVVRLAGALEVSTETLFEGIRWDPRAGEFVVVDPPELPRV